MILFGVSFLIFISFVVLILFLFCSNAYGLLNWDLLLLRLWACSFEFDFFDDVFRRSYILSPFLFGRYFEALCLETEYLINALLLLFNKLSLSVSIFLNFSTEFLILKVSSWGSTSWRSLHILSIRLWSYVYFSSFSLIYWSTSL